MNTLIFLSFILIWDCSFQIISRQNENGITFAEILPETTPQPPWYNPYVCACYPVSYCGKLGGKYDPRVLTPFNCFTGYQYCCPYYPPATPAPDICGNRSSIQPRKNNFIGRAVYGEYPWTGAILDADNSYLGGCVLIARRTVLTAAHKIGDFIDNDLKVRFGFVNGLIVDDNTKEYAVKTIIIHPEFGRIDFKNDIAILQFAEDVEYSAVIGTACLPNDDNWVADSWKFCWVSGWGKDSFSNGMYQSVQKTVQVPLINSDLCEAQLQTTRLGTDFILDRDSFICAGGFNNQDACTGDGGSPLVCELTNGQWTVVGLVSWGIGCGQPKIPGVYVNVAHFLPWIQSQNVL